MVAGIASDATSERQADPALAARPRAREQHEDRADEPASHRDEQREQCHHLQDAHPPPLGRRICPLDGSLDDLLWRTEPLQDVPHGRLAGRAGRAQGLIDVFADLRHELLAPLWRQSGGRRVEPAQVSGDQRVSAGRSSEPSSLSSVSTPSRKRAQSRVKSASAARPASVNW